MFKLSKFVHKTATTYSPKFFFTSKVCNNLQEAVSGVKSGNTVLFGGFGLCGIPENLIQGVLDSGATDLTCVSNNAGVDGFGLGILMSQRRIKRMIASYVGENAEFERQYLSGELEVELVPQGTLAEKIRSGGAGIPAYYTPTGFGTLVQEGGFPIKFKQGTNEPEILSKPKATAVYNGRNYVLEDTIFGDVAFVKAWKADTRGNLVYRKTTRNFNQDMATAAKHVVAEVEEIVEPGQLEPDAIHTPGVFVDKIFKSPKLEKRIERLVLDKGSSGGKEKSPAQLTRERIAARACKEVQNGMYINLGIGIPTLVPAFLPKDVSIELESENGILGVGPYPKEGEQDPDLINAGKETITEALGTSYFSSSQSFGIIRGAHLDMTILGGMQVSRKGDLANWIIPGKMVKGMGGAMDLVGSGSKVLVVMEHNAKGGAHKILDECSLPLTGKGVATKLITEKAVFNFENGNITLEEIAEGLSMEDLKKATGCSFNVVNNLKTF